MLYLPFFGGVGNGFVISFHLYDYTTSQFIKSVYVYRDYTLEIEFNVSFEDFRTMATECQEQSRNQQPVVYVTA